jgi:integrase
MLAAGVPIIDVSRILGHSNPEVTARVYAHSLEENRKRAVAAVTQLLQR